MQEMFVIMVGKVLAVLGLVAANGFFVASEFALVGVRRTRIDELVAQGNGTAKLLQRAVVGLDDSLAATQLGVTVSSLALGWIGESTLADLLEPVLSTLGRPAVASAHALATLGTFSVITVFHIVLGELVPKSVALQRPEPTDPISRTAHVLSRTSSCRWASRCFRPTPASIEPSQDSSSTGSAASPSQATRWIVRSTVGHGASASCRWMDVASTRFRFSLSRYEEI